MTEYVYNNTAATPAISPTANPPGPVTPVGDAAFEVVAVVGDVVVEVTVSLAVAEDVVLDVVLHNEMFRRKVLWAI